MCFDAIIIGAGPAGLACATRLGRHGIKTLVVERKKEIGGKTCAGGITWSGLLQTVPGTLIEKGFASQYVHTRLQNIHITATQPIIATVNREWLGRYMAQTALQNGVTIHTETHLRGISKDSVELYNHHTASLERIRFRYLIGADGSSSLVRRYLGLPSEKMGMGINYQIDAQCDNMEWHLDNRLFANGYGWVFPHKKNTSVGAYIPRKGKLSALQLKKNLIKWAKKKNIDLYNQECRAGLINSDFRGYQFDNLFLAGDAAGCASALTGEGIYPAIISGEAVAGKILDPQSKTEQMEQLMSRQKRFRAMVNITSMNGPLSFVLAEIGVLGLRTGLIDFTSLEMSK